MTDALDDFVKALDAADRRRAVELVSDLLNDGADPVDLLLTLVTPAQQVVGERWQRGEYSVAQEHAATAVSEAAVAVIGAWIPEPTEPRGYAVVACAEREWHALAARIVAESLRHLGWRTTFLGASTPAHHLAGYLHRLDPDVVAVSCSMPASLPTARRIVEAASEAGIPTLAGGRAFGSDASRALALGASGWAASPRDAAEVLATLRPVVEPVPALAHAGAEEQAELLLRSRELAVRVLKSWLAGLEGAGADCLVGLDAEAEYAVDHALHSLAAALLTDDVTILREGKEWLVTLLGARGCHAEAVPELWRVLSETAGEQLPVAARLLRETA
ncbi:cobalamin B12-binding domain-containing protein [Cryptosporangium phraense]|uniref:Twin-arginine translocation pathway signal protein n=1 Tax=Cryptosporangium phraense TaxID=2593070 RepID=A0A545AKJ8_9ACTN|nr:cobalamin-dependent protein [Cryptosporangium phraense]TQS41853.1 twin-arginine translocation pathway signal protein [Cryptosporangium phraense]